MKGHDILGNIAILKFDRKDKASRKKKEAERFLKEHKGVRTILEKTEKFHGRLRVPGTRFIAGENTKEALYKENNCLFRLNVETCYFSPRLASERKEIAGMVKKGENVLVMFGGVAPFAIAIANLAKPAKVVSVELGKECNKYAKENVKRNKVEKIISLIQGDVRRKIPKIKERFDRIVMPRPNLKDSFLDVAFQMIRKNGAIHYYGFYKEDKADEMKKLIINEAGRAKRKVKIARIKKAGDIGVRKFRYRADVKVLN